jgi:hypothetical protein
MRALCDLNHLVEPHAEENIVTEHEHRWIPLCEPLADHKRPSNTVGKALLSVFGPHSPVCPVVEQLRNSGRSCGGDEERPLGSLPA